MKPIVFYILDWVIKLINDRVTGISIMIRESNKQDLLVMTVAGTTSVAGIKPAPDSTGVPLLRYQASVCGGSCQSEVVGDKQVITATFRLSHPERSPLGDIAGMLTIMIAACQDVDFDYMHATDYGTYCFSTSEAKKNHNVKRLEGIEMLNTIGLSISKGLKKIGIADFSS